MKHLIIVGAGGFGLEVAAYAEDALRADTSMPHVKGFLDDTKTSGDHHGGYPILGSINSDIDPEALYIIAMGFPEPRKKFAHDLAARGARFHTLIHPQSYVARSAKLGEGCIITPFAVVGPETSLGAHCMLNHFSSVGHESTLGAYCVLCPHASVHGAGQLGESVFMGSGSYVTARLTVGDRAKLSAGAVVYSPVPNDALAIGNPAAFRKQVS